MYAYTLIRGAKVYQPKYLGRTDILIFDNKIIKIGNSLEKYKDLFDIRTIIDASGKIVVPGFIDSHIHFTGGGGAGYIANRCPEVPFEEIIKAGVTTAIGHLGIDCITKNLEGLLGKAQKLEAEGISAYILAGGYHQDRLSITGSPMKDIVFLDKIIGTGEIAISENRAIEPNAEQLKKIISESYVGGLLGEKSGVTVIHLGSGKKQCTMIDRILFEIEIPPSKIVITHVNRNRSILKEALYLNKQGINIDITAGMKPNLIKDTVKPSEAIKWLIDNGADLERITMSSDGYAGRSLFDEHGNLRGFQRNKVEFLTEEINDLIKKENVNISEALKVITSNPSIIYHLNNKGEISIGKDADLLVLNNDFIIDKVIAKGKIMVDGGEVVVNEIF